MTWVLLKALGSEFYAGSIANGYLARSAVRARTNETLALGAVEDVMNSFPAYRECRADGSAESAFR